MRVFYSEEFNLALPERHRFPATKYDRLRRMLIDEAILRPDQLRPSPLANDEALLRAHDPAYIRAIEEGAIAPALMRRIGFPWSPALARRARLSVGGSIAAARAALEDGISGQLAGGTHHAHRDFGAGYCIYNDFACAALALIAERRVRRVAIIDLDVHQGDGNAAILGPREDVFVLSLHGEKNFPFRKVASDLDIALPDATGDADYLAALHDALPAVFAFAPDIILYQAGVDPLAQDRLGRLALTHGGLRARDERVLSECRARGLPVAMAIGGGYADPIEESVRAYANTYRAARDVFAL